MVTRSGRRVRPVRRLVTDPEFGNARLTTRAELNYYASLQELGNATIDMIKDCHFGELGCVGAAVGGGFTNTRKLIPMMHEEAIATKDKEAWKKAVREEFDRIMDHNVFKIIN